MILVLENLPSYQEQEFNNKIEFTFDVSGAPSRWLNNYRLVIIRVIWDSHFKIQYLLSTFLTLINHWATWFLHLLELLFLQDFKFRFSSPSHHYIAIYFSCTLPSLSITGLPIFRMNVVIWNIQEHRLWSLTFWVCVNLGKLPNYTTTLIWKMKVTMILILFHKGSCED